MDIRLKRIKLRNFKIHKDLSVEPDGHDLSIYGNNQLGKTTIYDAFMWLLFNKSSEGRSDFTVKPMGVERPEVEVAVVLTVDGKEVELKKILKEKWQTKRGGREEAFTGHETSYFVNGLESTQGDYKSYLDTITSEDTFRRLTSAAFFLSLKKADMRSLLVEMAGEFDSQAIFDKHPGLKELCDYLNDKDFTVEEALKLAKQQLSLYSAENDKISVRIDEVNLAIPAEPEKGWQAVEDGLAKARENLRKVDEKLGSLHLAAAEVKKTQGEIAALQDNIRQYRIDRIDEANKEVNQARNTLESTKGLLAEQATKKRSVERLLSVATTEYADLKQKMDRVRDDYQKVMAEIKEEDAKEYVPIAGGTQVCELCNQPLPLDQVQEHEEQHKALFMKRKAESMAEMIEKKDKLLRQGNGIKAQAVELKESGEKLQQEIKDIDQETKVIEAAIAEQMKKLQDSTVDDVDLSADQEYQDMLKRLETLKSQLVEPKDDSQELLEYKSKMQSYAEKFSEVLRSKADIEKGKRRIDELVARGKELSGLIAVERKRLSMCEDYIRARAELLSDKINGMFTIVRFRLFDQQINGSIADDCTPMVKSKNGEYVELTKDGSNSERIRAGMDIVNTMQRHEQIFVPVFVDNAEAATTLTPMDCQVIRLVVSEQDKELRIVTDKKRGEEKASDPLPTSTDSNSIDSFEQIDFDKLLGGF